MNKRDMNKRDNLSEFRGKRKLSNLDVTLLIFYEDLDKKFNNYPNFIVNLSHIDYSKSLEKSYIR